MWCWDSGSKSVGSLGTEVSRRMAHWLGVLVALLEDWALSVPCIHAVPHIHGSNSPMLSSCAFHSCATYMRPGKTLIHIN